MNAYKELINIQQKEVNDFPMFFAFDNDQFKQGMEEFGLAPTDTDKINKVGGTGGYCLSSDTPRLNEMFIRHKKERQDAIDADSTGEGFIYQMFRYELANHEYGYTWDESYTLAILGFSHEDIENSEALKNGLKKAIATFKHEG